MLEYLQVLDVVFLSSRAVSISPQMFSICSRPIFLTSVDIQAYKITWFEEGEGVGWGSFSLLTSSVRALTRISFPSFLWDKGKQYRPRSDAAQRGVWSGSPLFAYRMYFQNLNELETYYPTTLKFETDSSN